MGDDGVIDLRRVLDVQTVRRIRRHIAVEKSHSLRAHRSVPRLTMQRPLVSRLRAPPKQVLRRTPRNSRPDQQFRGTYQRQSYEGFNPLKSISYETKPLVSARRKLALPRLAGGGKIAPWRISLKGSPSTRRRPLTSAHTRRPPPMAPRSRLVSPSRKSSRPRWFDSRFSMYIRQYTPAGKR